MNINNLCPRCMKEVNKENIGTCPYCGCTFSQIKQVQHQLKPFTILAGKYLVGEVLGEGGFGITYIGLDLNLEIRVAIKEFYPNGYVTREAQSTSALTIYTGKNTEIIHKWRDSFIKEARSLAKCSHLLGVVRVKEFFQENNTAYIVQEYLEGETLKEYIKKKGGKISAEWLLPALRPVMAALGEVHKEGLIHRDISPDNIMILSNGQMKLLDFGAARDFTQEGEKSLSVMLKPGYAPEEQYRSKGKQGPWSDIYAFAGTIYKCITGVTPPESMERIRKDELKKPSELGIELAPGIEKALLKAMAVFAEDRYQTMKEFEEALLKDQNVVNPVSKKEIVPENLKKDSIKFEEKNEKNKLGELIKNPRWLGIVGIIMLIFVGVVLLGGKEKKDNGKELAEVSTSVGEDNVEEITDEELLIEKAQQFSQEGAYETALTFYDQALTLEPENEDIYIGKADIYLAQENPLAAMDVLNDAVMKLNTERIKEYKNYVKENTKVIYKKYYNQNNQVDVTEYKYEYDKRGNLIKETSYYSDGSISSWTENAYDTQGKNIKHVGYNGNGSIEYWTENMYDSQGNTIRHTRYRRDGSLHYWYENEYDYQGNKLKYSVYNEFGDITYFSENKYDSQGNLKEIVSYDELGNLSFWEVYEHDLQGNVIKYTKYNKDGFIEYWTETEYDNQGNMIKKNVYDSNGRKEYWEEYEYDSLGGETRKTRYNYDGESYSWIDETEYRYQYFGEIKSLQISNDEVSYQETDKAIHRYELIIADVTWEQAYQESKNRGGYLVHINSADEFNVITNQIKNEQKTKYTFWVGANREDSSYNWVDVNGNRSDDIVNESTYRSFWLDDEPSYYGQDANGYQVEERYVDMIYRGSDDRFYLNDVPNNLIGVADYLSGKIGYICEYES